MTGSCLPVWYTISRVDEMTRSSLYRPWPSTYANEPRPCTAEARGVFRKVVGLANIAPQTRISRLHFPPWGGPFKLTRVTSPPLVNHVSVRSRAPLCEQCTKSCHRASPSSSPPTYSALSSFRTPGP